MSPKRFAEVTSLRQRPAGDPPSVASKFDVDIDEDWTIAGRPNGGYLMALLARSGLYVSRQEHVIASSGTYVRPPDAGAAEVSARVLREGRSASQIRATLTQGGAVCVEALLSVGTLDESSKPYWTDRSAAAPDCAFEECLPLLEGPPGGHRAAIMEQVEVRLDKESLGFTRGIPSGRGELRGWLTLPGGERFDSVSLLYAADAFPPASFEVESAGWVPTLQLTVYVRALPAPGPVQVLQRARLIQGRMLDEECIVWDSNGALVAQATQLAGIRLG